MKRVLIDQFRELRESVKLSSEHTQRQLSNIDKNTIIGAVISLIVALGTSFNLKTLTPHIETLTYWIPASFSLLFLWIIYSIFSLLRKNKKRDNKSNFNEKISIDALNYSIKVNLMAFSIIYIITLIIFTMILLSNILQINEIYQDVPMITVILTIIISISISINPFLVDYSIKSSKNEELKNILKNEKIKNILEKIDKYAIYISCICMAITLIPFYFLLLKPLITIFSENLSFLILITILQFIFVFLSASYISAVLAKKELTNSITTYTDINDKINEILLYQNEKLNQKNLDKLLKRYLEAKRFEMHTTSMFNLVNIYYLIPKQVFDKKKNY